MNCGNSHLNMASGNTIDFSDYSNESENQTIFDSKLKGKKELSEPFTHKEINSSVDTLLPVGLYKITLEIEGKQNIEHFTDIGKAVLIDNEIKDIYFYKVDIIPETNELGNGKTTVTAIFEIMTNPIPIIFIIYALGSIGVGITGAIVIKRMNQLITQSIPSIIPDIIKIGASVIVILLGIKVISKW